MLEDKEGPDTDFLVAFYFLEEVPNDAIWEGPSDNGEATQQLIVVLHRNGLDKIWWYTYLLKDKTQPTKILTERSFVYKI